MVTIDQNKYKYLHKSIRKNPLFHTVACKNLYDWTPTEQDSEKLAPITFLCLNYSEERIFSNSFPLGIEYHWNILSAKGASDWTTTHF